MERPYLMRSEGPEVLVREDRDEQVKNVIKELMLPGLISE